LLAIKSLTQLPSSISMRSAKRPSSAPQSSAKALSTRAEALGMFAQMPNDVIEYMANFLSAADLAHQLTGNNQITHFFKTRPLVLERWTREHYRHDVDMSELVLVTIGEDASFDGWTQRIVDSIPAKPESGPTEHCATSGLVVETVPPIEWFRALPANIDRGFMHRWIRWVHNFINDQDLLWLAVFLFAEKKSLWKACLSHISTTILANSAREHVDPVLRLLVLSCRKSKSKSKSELIMDLLDLAVRAGFVGAVRMILARAEVTDQARQGNTLSRVGSIEIAAALGRSEIVQLLLNDQRITPRVPGHDLLARALNGLHDETAMVLARSPRVTSAQADWWPLPPMPEEVFSLLLQKEYTAADCAQSILLVRTVKYNRLDLTRLVLDDGRFASPAHCVAAMVVAQEEGRTEHVRMIIKSGRCTRV